MFIGQQFSPGARTDDRNMQFRDNAGGGMFGSGPDIGTAIQLLRLRFPHVFGASAPAPRSLFTSPGGSMLPPAGPAVIPLPLPGGPMAGIGGSPGNHGAPTAPGPIGPRPLPGTPTLPGGPYSEPVPGMPGRPSGGAGRPGGPTFGGTFGSGGFGSGFGSGGGFASGPTPRITMDIDPTRTGGRQ